MNIELKNLDNLTNDEKETLIKLVKKANEKSKVFVPEYGGKYYIIDPRGKIKCLPFGDDEYDEDCFSIGNCFETREETKFALEKQKVYTQLKRYALEHNECAIDWGNLEQIKWALSLNSETNNLLPQYTWQYYKSSQVVYFTSEEIAKNAIAEIGEDKIKKYLFEVEEND